MTRLILSAISKTGRYFCLLISLPIFIGAYFWLGVLDNYPIVFLVGLIVILPVLLLAVALLLGMLFAGSEPSENIGITRDEAPELWRHVDDAFGRTNLRLFVDERVNASVSSTRSLFGIFGRTTHLVIGVPLMAVLTLDEFDALLRHEAAHLRFKDTVGSNNTLEFYRCFDFLFDFAPPGETVSGTIAAFALSDFSTVTRREAMRLSRIAELRADAFASQSGGAEAVLRTLILMEATSEFFSERIEKPLLEERLKSFGHISSVYTRFMARRGDLHDPQLITELWKIAASRPSEADSSHPSSLKRVEVLGGMPSRMPHVSKRSAFEILVPEKLRDEITQEFEESWLQELEEFNEH